MKLNQASEHQIELIDHFREWLCGEFGLTEKMRYSIPFFYGQKSWVCYLNPLKNGYVEFAFIRGNELSDPHNILHAKGRKMIRGLEFIDIKTVDILKLSEILEDAILLDETIPFKLNSK